LYVDAEGGLHACEKMNHSFPLGHADSGLTMRRCMKSFMSSLKLLKITAWIVIIDFYAPGVLSILQKRASFD
jgi:hypothetical protein